MQDLFLLLKAINHKPINNQRDLAGEIGLSVGKVNALLKEAEERHLLTAKREGKQSRFQLTATGEQLLENTLLQQQSTKLSLGSELGQIKTAVILAGGRQKDFQGPVVLLSLEEQTVLERTLSVLESCGIERFVIVTGYHAADVAEAVGSRKNVTLIENTRYKWTGTMAGLALAKDELREGFLLLKGDIVFEQRAISEILEEKSQFCTILSAPGGQAEESFVELDHDGNIFRITKDIRQINKVQGELVGISKVPAEVYGKMLEYYEENQNPLLGFEYVVENIGRIYRFHGTVIDDLVWGKLDDNESYQTLINIAYPRILRKEKEMKERLAADTLVEILGIQHEDIVEISFAGGLTNTNYYVELKEKRYILRLPGRMTESMINRVNEKRNAQIASNLGYNCNLICCNEKSGIKLSEYIDGAETFNPRTVKLEKNMKLTAEILCRLHHEDFVWENTFDPFGEIHKYEYLLDISGGIMYEGCQAVREQVLALKDRLEVIGAELRPCHNDLVAANLVKNNENRLYLIDWEYSGNNDPMFDVAALFLENDFEQEDEELFFHYYFGDDRDLSTSREKILIFKIVQDYLWSIWTVLKEAKGDDFGSYGLDRFNRSVQLLKLWQSEYQEGDHNS